MNPFNEGLPTRITPTGLLLPPCVERTFADLVQKANLNYLDPLVTPERFSLIPEELACWRKISLLLFDDNPDTTMILRRARVKELSRPTVGDVLRTAAVYPLALDKTTVFLHEPFVEGGVLVVSNVHGRCLKRMKPLDIERFDWTNRYLFAFVES